MSDAELAALAEVLRQRLKAERQRAIEGHWTYSLARHNDLYRDYLALKAHLRSRSPGAGEPTP